MKKILLFLSFLLMSIGAWGTDVTFEKTDFTSSNTSTKSGVTVSMSSNVTIDNQQFRFNCQMTVNSTNILTRIDVETNSTEKYISPLGNTVSNGSWNKNTATKYYWVGNSTSVVFTPNSAIRITKITVTYINGTTYTVTYNSNGGTETMTDSNSPYNDGATVTTLTNAFAREGYTFTNWNTQADGSGINYDEGDTFTISANTTLYAQWKKIVVPPTPIGECIFSESFTESTGTMGWSGSAANGTFKSDNDGWATENSYGAGGSAKFGASSKKGSAETPSIPYNGSNDLTLTFNSGAWDYSSEVTTVNLSAINATLDQNSITLTKGSWTTYTIKLTNVSNNFKIKWEASAASNNRFFLDDICISEDETCLPTISVAKIEQGGTFDLSNDSVCENGTVTLSNIRPSDGYKFDTIICLAQEGEEFVEHGTVNVSNSTISGITKDCYVVVIFSQLPPEPEIEIVEWNPDYIKVDIDNFDAVTAVIENKNTQEVHEDNVATELFFSKYFEAESTIKLLGIYNGTKDSINLKNYEIKIAQGTRQTSWNRQYPLKKLEWIHSGEEIILYSYDTNADDIVECINNYSTTGGFEKYIRVQSGGLVPDLLQFNGDDAVGLFKSETLIDIIGAGNSSSANTSGLSMTGADNNSPKDTLGHIIDMDCWITDKADDSNGYSSVIGTNLCLLIRKSTVHSGDSAVKYNVTDFVTLADEWIGKVVSRKDSSTCKNFDYVGSFDYNEHYAQYTQVGEKILLGQTEPDGSYKISIPELDTLSCTLLKVIVNDNSDKSEEREYKIPIFVTENTNSVSKLFSQEGADCPDCDVVIINGSKLTVNSELTNRDVTVYPGGVLVIPEGQTYKVNSLTLRRENNEVPYFSYKGHLVLTDKFYIDLRTDADDWRWMTLPFSHKVSDITYPNGKKPTLNSEMFLEYYDGEYRAQHKSGAWKFHNYDDVFNAGQGFLFGVDLPGHSKKTYRFSFIPDSVEHEKSDKIVKNLFSWGGNNTELAPNHKGWNMIGNPFMDNDTTDITQTIGIGFLKKDSVDGHWTGGWEVKEGTSGKLRYAVIPNKDEKFADAGYYESVVLDDYILKPLTSFFVQLGGNEEDMQTINFKTTKRTNRIVARNYQMQGDDETFLRIKVDNWKTGCFISNKFTEDYEPGDDLESRYCIYQSIGGYKLLYSAINDSIIENGIKVTSPSGNLHLDEKTNVDEFEYIYVLYNDNWYDLLHGEAVDVENGYFILQAKRKNNGITTDINHIPTQGLYKYTDGINIYINKNGTIFDIVGSKIK